MAYSIFMQLDEREVTDWKEVRSRFPILSTKVGEHPLIYLDNAASTQKPERVLESMREFYRTGYANIHRGVHHLSQTATEAFEGARRDIARRFGAKDSEVIFTRGATESINLVAHSLGLGWKNNTRVLVTEMEHHANIVPWQLLEKRGIVRLEVAPITPECEVDLEAFERILQKDPPALVSFVWASNAVGTINPVRTMIQLAKSVGALVLVDACQAIQHMEVDVHSLGCDFLVFSGHKLYGPTGIGVLWGKSEVLHSMEPYQGGGDMIDIVSFSGTTFKEAPARFEAGTPAIAEAIGLQVAFEELHAIGIPAIMDREVALLRYAEEALSQIEGLTILGRAEEKVAVVSFTMDCAHPHDIGTFLDADGIAIRTGHHCCMPLMEKLGLPGTARASFSFYNTFEEVDRLAVSLRKVLNFFA